MQTPNTLSEFITLISSMKHRERFVFPANNALKTKYENKDLNIEIYNTILFDSIKLDRNISIHLVTNDGTPVSKKSKIFRLWDNDFFSKVFVMLDQNKDPETTQKVLELKSEN